MSVNIQIIIGRLGQDPDSRAFADGGSVCNLSVATTESYKDKNTNERKEITTWHRVVLRNRLGEVAQQYLRKGSQVFIKGVTRHRKWQNQQGQDQFITEIMANEMTMLDSRNDGQNSGHSTGQSQPSHANAGPDYGAPGSDYLDDDVPF